VSFKGVQEGVQLLDGVLVATPIPTERPWMVSHFHDLHTHVTSCADPNNPTWLTTSYVSSAQRRAQAHPCVHRVHGPPPWLSLLQSHQPPTSRISASSAPPPRKPPMGISHVTWHIRPGHLGLLLTLSPSWIALSALKPHGQGSSHIPPRKPARTLSFAIVNMLVG
jgi:hypothetical protein